MAHLKETKLTSECIYDGRIVRLERDTQLVVPAYDYCMPEKECPGTITDDPCTLFSRIHFPVEEFFPPDSISETEDYRSLK